MSVFLCPSRTAASPQSRLFDALFSRLLRRRLFRSLCEPLGEPGDIEGWQTFLFFSVLFEVVVAFEAIVFETTLAERLKHHVAIHDTAHDVAQDFKANRRLQLDLNVRELAIRPLRQ